jgi:DNA-binding MarR family transcriptional regulator
MKRVREIPESSSLKLIAYVKSHPNCTAKDIEKGLGWTQNKTQRTLASNSNALKKGYVVAKKVVDFGKSITAKLALNYLPATRMEIQQKCRVSKTSANSALLKLISMGLVRRVRAKTGKSPIYKMTAKAKQPQGD